LTQQGTDSPRNAAVPGEPSPKPRRAWSIGRRTTTWLRCARIDFQKPLTELGAKSQQ
jgi:hypothetical protein